MKKIIFIYAFSLLAMSIALSCIFSMFEINIIKMYSTNIRGTLFTAFLTMGSFTLSLMSIFMFSLKDKLFDDKDYKKLYEAKQKIQIEDLSIYSPLVNISRLFLFCVICCFITSIAQFTISLFESIYGIAFCLSIALCTIFLALIILYNVWMNIEVWFKILLKKKDTESP